MTLIILVFVGFFNLKLIICTRFEVDYSQIEGDISQFEVDQQQNIDFSQFHVQYYQNKIDFYLYEAVCS